MTEETFERELQGLKSCSLFAPSIEIFEPEFMRLFNSVKGDLKQAELSRDLGLTLICKDRIQRLQELIYKQTKYVHDISVTDTNQDQDDANNAKNADNENG
jgi:hypothetical protein